VLMPARFDPDLLGQHFDDHGREFFATDEAHYESQAIAFMTAKPAVSGQKCNACPDCDCTAYGPLHECKRPENGDTIRYNTVTNEYGVMSKYGIIRTYFKPNPVFHRCRSNIDYFHHTCKP
jgi:hypothetical protein